MFLKVWGCRGSLPTPGSTTVKYGGNTSCYEIRNNDNELLILDAGTGLRELGNSLMKELPLKAHMLFSHTHWDHIMGYPFCVPIFIPGNVFHLHGPTHFNSSFEDVMTKSMDYTFFPVRMQELGSTLTFEDMKEGVYEFGSFTINVKYMNHPILCLGFKINCDGKTIVYTGDTEPYYDTVYGDNEPSDEDEEIEKAELLEFVNLQNEGIVEFLRDVDLVVYDCTYTAEEYPAKKGWGHTSMEHAIDVCEKAKVKQLIMTHHEPTRTDEQLDELLKKLRAQLKNTNSKLVIDFAREKQTYTP